MKCVFKDILEIKNGKNQKNVENSDGVYPIYGSGGIMGYADDYICPSDTVIIGRKGNINSPIYVEEPFWNVDTAFGLIANRKCLIAKYLFYFCKKFNFEKLNKAVTIPSLTKSDLLEIKIDLPDKSSQQLIVDRLNTVERVIDLRQRELSQLDNLIKARFVEMFGLPGTDVKGWGMVTLGSICEINPRKAKDSRLTKELKISFVPMTAVSDNGGIDTSEIKTYDEVRTGFTYFSENDVLFAKITPCMENGKGAVAVDLYNGIGFGSTEFHVLRPIKNMSNPYWLYTLAAFKLFRKEAAANMTGSAGQRRVPARYLENYKVTLPPIELQRRFADFVTQVDKSKVVA
ncbi:MAG: restriction endonuclease subunit S [Clostridia bacterium]